jgi:hypothetical protein
MALTNIQREVCRILAKQRIASGSQDLDLFHGTAAALAATWSADRAALLDAGYDIEVIRERPTFVEAIVRRGTETVILQWTHYSAFRFFPLVEHPELGLTLHPFHLATNKVLALVGRVEARDWIDILQCQLGCPWIPRIAHDQSERRPAIPGLTPFSIFSLSHQEQDQGDDAGGQSEDGHDRQQRERARP